MHLDVAQAEVLVAVSALLAVAMVVLAVQVGRTMRTNRALRFEIERVSAASQQLSAPLRRMERDLEFVTHFVNELPRMMTGFASCNEVRQLPQMLVEAMVTTFQAEQAVVVLRRRSTLSDPERGNSLIVAAAAAPESGLEPGAEIPIGDGELGFAAEVERAMDRQDFDDETAVNRERIRHAAHLPLDAVAPMLAGGKLMGVIGFARPARRLPWAKDMLHGIAQVGALALYHMLTYRRARVAADLDGLTGVLNKTALQFRLSELVYEAGEQDRTVAVFMFDIDNFKSYNDLNGHVAGDEALRLVARLAGESVRADDIFGRFGGEEFLVILPGRTTVEARVAAESIRLAIAGFAFPFGERQPLGRVTISGGVAAYPADGDDSIELLKAADAALYRAKRAGRNRVAAPGDDLPPLQTGR